MTKDCGCQGAVLPGVEAHEAGGQDLAEFGQAFGGSEAVGEYRARTGVAVDHGDFSIADANTMTMPTHIIKPRACACWLQMG